MQHILVVEDNPDILLVIQDLLESEGYRLTVAGNGLEGVRAFELQVPDLIISDLMMPRLDGFGLLEVVRSRPEGAAVPFLFLSARTDAAVTTRARSLGADDYLFKPFSPEDLLVAIRAKIDRRRTLRMFDTRSAHLQTVQMLANTIEAREGYTRGHIERVQGYALALARALNWGPEALAICEFGAILHDIGKIQVSRRILNKRRKLVYSEWAVLRKHPEVGAHMLHGIDHLHDAIPYVLCHHERWDGSGYPHGLTGRTIPREGRLLNIVDTYDAMTSDRPYRKALSPEQALDEIKRGAERQFDPEIVEVFVALQHKAT